jgi:hypothetical protein
MKKLIATSAIVFLLSIPVISYAQPEQNVQKAPPVSQPFVREGNFAIKLVEVLKLGTAKNEAEAESRLASMGIAPRNGWIADYPLTPDIIGELRNAVGVALDSGKLAMNKDEATMAVQVLVDNQWRQPVAPGEEQARQYGEYPPAVYEGYEGGYEPYYNSEPYYSPYYSPYPYYYGGYYSPYLYPYFGGGFVIRGFRGGGRGGGSHGGGGHGGGHR